MATYMYMYIVSLLIEDTKAELLQFPRILGSAPINLTARMQFNSFSFIDPQKKNHDILARKQHNIGYILKRYNGRLEMDQGPAF